MKELEDYSGEFSPDVRPKDFSKDALLRFLDTAARLYLGLDGIWFALMIKKFGDQVAKELVREAWLRATPIEIGRTMAAANIKGDDVATLFKAYQCDPAITGVNDVQFELKDKNHGIFTVKHCVTLDSFERRGDVEAIKFACGLDTEMWSVTCTPVNPKIKVTLLKRPPRERKDDIACQWEFRLDG